jgi:hypothetical protein
MENLEKQEEEPMEEKSKVIWEHGWSEAKGGSVYRVERRFMLKVADGPLRTVKTGDIVGLSDETGLELFYCCKITPLGIPVLGQYEVINGFKIVEGGVYRHLKRGERLELADNEAIEFLRLRKVKLLREVTNEDSIFKSD